jgi:hypothetical protein
VDAAKGERSTRQNEERKENEPALSGAGSLLRPIAAQREFVAEVAFLHNVRFQRDEADLPKNRG